MEVALGVVDASAVVPPSSHVIPDVAESDVLVFDPLDSDEEEELDASSRNATGAIQVDRDDVPMCWPFLHRGCTRIASQAQRLILSSPQSPFVRLAKQVVKRRPWFKSMSWKGRSHP